MKKLRILRTVLIRTGANKLIMGFVAFFLLDALVIMLVEPGIHNYLDAMWYSYAVFSTAGFGDITPVTFIGRAMSVVLTIYTILICGIVTGVIVAYYNDVVSMRYKASKAEVLDQLEHLEDLPKEELRELSEKIRKIGV